MNNPRLATRYAKSLIDLATELNQLDAISTDMKWLHKICKTNPDFVAVLRSPIIKADKKEKIIQAVINDRVNQTTASFIHLLVKKGREISLPEIANAYITQFNTLQNIYQVKISTAIPVTDEMRDVIVEKVKTASPDKRFELETVVNEDLIGGFVLETDGKLVDASILRDLNDIKKQFLNNDYIHKIR
ncbi:MAG: ATP synthase F1 subunit delta [Chitinophagaceae bacterium]|nr:ATP synthase F1 subunit delta [Chitinophagaceae bacterium]